MPLPSPSPTSTAVITGASSGIGADIARELASRGHGVTLVARREDRLRSLADELADAVRVEVIACDVADPDARGALLDAVADRGLTVDILVNNAGVGTIGSITKTMTAVLVMQCRDEGLLDLDDAVGRWLPESAHRDVTVRALLSHTAGLSSEPAGEWWERTPGVDAARIPAAIRGGATANPTRSPARP